MQQPAENQRTAHGPDDEPAIGRAGGKMEPAAFIAKFCGALALTGMVLGCQADRSAPPPPAVAVAIEAPAAVPPDAAAAADAGDTSFGEFNITFYYVAAEEESAPLRVARAERPATVDAPVADEVPDASDGADPGSDPADEQTVLPASADPDGAAVLAAAEPAPAGPTGVTIYGPGCRAITEVSPDFAAALEMQGTGKLHDGRIVNIWGACRCATSPCYQVTDNQWGSSGTGRPLQPFRTVAVDPKVIPLGTLLYIPILEGRQMPGRAPWGGFVHDGCVLADDTGGGIDGHQIDLFVGRKGYYKALGSGGGSHSWATHAVVQDGSEICRREGREIHRAVPRSM